MSSLINIRQQVLNEINQLDHEQLDLVLSFLHSLKFSKSTTADKDKLRDPLADFIGAVKNGCHERIWNQSDSDR